MMKDLMIALGVALAVAVIAIVGLVAAWLARGIV